MTSFIKRNVRMGAMITKKLSVLMALWLVSSMAVYVNKVAAQGQSYNGLMLSTDTQNLKPGEINKVKFRLANNGNLDLKSIILTINMPSSTQSSEAPMYIINGDGRHYIDGIASGQSIDILETIYVNPKSANTEYMVKVDIYYQAGGDYVDTRYVGFIIGSLTETGAVIDVTTSTNNIVSGTNSTVMMYIKNAGDSDAINLDLSMSLPAGGVSAPLTLRNSDGAWTIDTLEVNQTEAIPIEFFAAPSSAGNVYLITLSITYSDNFSQKEIVRYISLGVPYPRTQGAVIKAVLDNQNLASGATNSRVLTISNTGDQSARNILVSLETPNTQSIALIGQSGYWNIEEMDPGKSYTIPIQLFVTTAATGAVYSIPISVSYIDSDYRQKQEKYEIGVVVFGSVIINTLDSTTYPPTISPGKTFSITSTIINLGTTSAQSVIVTPEANGVMRPLTNGTMFVGDLSVNVPSSITLTYVAGDVKNQTYPIELEYSYRLSTSQQYTDKLTIPVKIVVAGKTTSTANVIPQPQTQTNSLVQYLPYSVVLVAILVVVYVYIRRRSAK